MRTQKQEKYTQEFLEKLLEITDFRRLGIHERSLKSKYNTNNVINRHQINGSLTILKFIPNGVVKEETTPLYLCRCDCGRLAIKKCNHVINETVTTCGSCVKSKYTNRSWIGVELNGYKVIGIGYTSQVTFDIECIICHMIHTVSASCFCNGIINNCECTRNSIENKAKKLSILKNIKPHGYIQEVDEYIFDKLNIDGVDYYKTACSKCYLQRIRPIKNIIEKDFGAFKSCICKRESLDRGPRGDTAGTRKFSALELLKLEGTTQGKLLIKKLNWGGSIKKSTYTCDCTCGRSNIELDAVGISLGMTHECGKCLKAPNAKYMNRSYIGQIFWNNLKVTDIVVENAKTYWICDCLNCGSHGNKISAHGIVYGNNKSCGCIKSYGELVISKCLHDNNLKFKSQATFDGLVGVGGSKLRFDFVVYKDNKPYIALEYDGKQHFEPVDFSNGYEDRSCTLERFRIIQLHDELKNKYCKDKGIFIHRFSGQITYDEVLTVLHKYNIIGGNQHDQI